MKKTQTALNKINSKLIKEGVRKGIENLSVEESIKEVLAFYCS